MTQKLLYCSFYLVFLFVFTQCDLPKADDFDASQQEIAFPLLEAKAKLTDFLTSEVSPYVVIEKDGLLKLNYQKIVTDQKASNLLPAIQNIPTIPLFDTLITVPYKVGTGFQPSFIRFNGGNLYTDFQSSYIFGAAHVSFSIPQLKDDKGAVFQKNFWIQKGERVAQTINLNGYSLDLTGGNKVDFKYKVINDETKWVRDVDGFVAISNLSFSYAEGIIGDERFDEPAGVLDINFFEELNKGDLYVEDPKVTFLVSNSFGIPFRAVPRRIEVKTLNGEIIPFKSTELEKGLEYGVPDKSEASKIQERTFIFDKTNSNILEVVNKNPIQFSYDIDAQTAPDKANETGFLTADSRLTMLMNVEIPFYFRSTGYQTERTYNIDLSEIKSDNVQSAEFKILMLNKMPVDVKTQIYFADASGIIQDSLLNTSNQQNLIASAPTDTQGNAVSNTEKTTFITISSDRLTRIKRSKKIILKTFFSTYNQGKISVKVLNSQDITVKVSVKCKN